MLADARVVITLRYVNLSNQHAYLTFTQCSTSIISQNKLEKRSCQTFFQSDYLILCSHQQGIRVLVPPHPHQHLAWSLCKILAIPIGMVSHFCFHLHFPNNWWCLASFHVLIHHPHNFFGKIKSVQIFCLISLWVVCFLVTEFFIHSEYI